jgi:hypothetical protein
VCEPSYCCQASKCAVAACDAHRQLHVQVDALQRGADENDVEGDLPAGFAFEDTGDESLDATMQEAQGEVGGEGSDEELGELGLEEEEEEEFVGLEEGGDVAEAELAALAAAEDMCALPARAHVVRTDARHSVLPHLSCPIWWHER